MINHQDQSSFDDNLQHQEMKQTAQFFNPRKSSLVQTIKFQQKQLQRIGIKSPKEQALKLNFDEKKNVLSQQVYEKRNSQTYKQLGNAKSVQQFVQNQYITPVLHKYGSPPKLQNVPSVKPFSPPQPKSSIEHVVVTQNNSAAPNIQKSGKDKQFQIRQTTVNEFNISMADLQPNHKHFTTKQTEEYVKSEYPSYQKSLLDSRQSKFNSEQMDQTNSEAFLPRINPQNQKINTNQFIGYRSIPQSSQQETALRTNSSKQTINPINEFISISEEDISRQSRTAQYLRDSLEQQNQQKLGFKINNIKQNDQQNPQLPLIQSPQSRGFKPFLERTPQKKIIDRLFSSKSDNNQLI
ncbi:unnamed protein product [Paramecium sonneborni]|uniref:Uncharacterized protein n=1 Tax=Paramecium sonneborni TaxID=65129 RepID=A0A8S1R0L5_9CILI|nr:unnamed protein product [Paramecium sonneborni]